MAQMVRMQGEFVSSIRRRAPRGCAPGRRPTACDVSLPRNSPAASATRPPAFAGRAVRAGRHFPPPDRRVRHAGCAPGRRPACAALSSLGIRRRRTAARRCTSRRSIGARRHVECRAGRRVTARDAFPPHGIPRRRARRALPRFRGRWTRRFGPRRSPTVTPARSSPRWCARRTATHGLRAFPRAFGGDERAAPFRVLLADGSGDRVRDGRHVVSAPERRPTASGAFPPQNSTRDREAAASATGTPTLSETTNGSVNFAEAPGEGHQAAPGYS